MNKNMYLSIYDTCVHLKHIAEKCEILDFTSTTRMHRRGTQDNMYVLSEKHKVETRHNFTYNQSKMCPPPHAFFGVKLETKLVLPTETSFNKPTCDVVSGDFIKGSY